MFGFGINNVGLPKVGLLLNFVWEESQILCDWIELFDIFMWKFYNSHLIIGLLVWNIYDLTNRIKFIYSRIYNYAVGI